MDEGSRQGRTPARTIVVDDHDVSRLGLVAILNGIPGIRVVKEAYDGPTAVSAVRSHDLDLVLMDVRMPDTEGLEATRQIRAISPQTRIIMVSYYDVPEYRAEALAAGAMGYISKGANRKAFECEITRVLRGEPYTATTAQPRAAAVSSTPSLANAAAVVDRLAPRQREVLALVGLGLRNREIGERLGISTRTVQKTVERILKYLGVPNRTQAAMIWITSGRRTVPAAEGVPG
ncbi:MAG: response regulator transcription factor [Chloroflexi bacterium]|nr:response regulator transcription factor [Chloroflexota bacterium]